MKNYLLYHIRIIAQNRNIKISKYQNIKIIKIDLQNDIARKQ